MNLRKFLITLVWIICSENVHSEDSYNITTEWGPQPQHDRQKRFIIWENGGICKIVAGVTFPVDFGDKKPWRNLNCAYNLQAQFAVPQKPIYWWDKWNGRSLLDAKLQYNRDGTYASDESRRFIYALIELYADRKGRNGKKCFLRAICENAAVDQVEGIFTEILQAVLTPGDDYDEEYKDAYKAGRYGAICTSLYPECPPGQGIFDSIFYNV